MSEIKTTAQLWAHVSHVVNDSQTSRLNSHQIASICSRLGKPVPKYLDGQPIRSITGFDIGEWHKAGERARVTYGMPYPKPTWNPLKFTYQRVIWAKSKITGSPTAPIRIADPWARHEAWRYNGPFNPRDLRWKGTFPGFGIAAGAFGLYLAYDYFLAPEQEHH